MIRSNFIYLFLLICTLASQPGCDKDTTTLNRSSNQVMGGTINGQDWEGNITGGYDNIDTTRYNVRFFRGNPTGRNDFTDALFINNIHPDMTDTVGVVARDLADDQTAGAAYRILIGGDAGCADYDAIGDGLTAKSDGGFLVIESFRNSVLTGELNVSMKRTRVTPDCETVEWIRDTVEFREFRFSVLIE